MRLIGQLSLPAAETFARYLESQHIDCRLDSPPASASGPRDAVGRPAPPVEIWVVDEDRVDTARALFSRFLSMPDAPEFASAPRRISRDAPVVSKGAAPDTLGNESSAISDISFPPAIRIPFGTFALVLAMAIAQFTPASHAWLVFDAHSVLEHFQVWRIFTPALLHENIWSLVFSVLWILHFGRHIERRMGSLGLLLLTLLAAGAATLAGIYGLPRLAAWAYASGNPRLSMSLQAAALLTPGSVPVAYAFYAYWLVSLARNSHLVLARRQIFLPGMHIALIAYLLLLLASPSTASIPLLYLASALPVTLVALFPR